MYNILLDPLPYEWNGYPIDADFQTGIQISMCMSDTTLGNIERKVTATNLLFPEEKPPQDEAMKAVEWFLNDYNHDHHKKSSTKVMDWDVDQWRIYAAFLNQYSIDLNTTQMHWFVFMGLLSNLQESSFSTVIDIRQKKITPKMSAEEKKAYSEAKRTYALSQSEELLSDEDKKIENEALEHFQQLIGRR